MVTILYILAGIIVIFILTGGLSRLMTDKEYEEREKRERKMRDYWENPPARNKKKNRKRKRRK